MRDWLEFSSKLPNRSTDKSHIEDFISVKKHFEAHFLFLSETPQIQALQTVSQAGVLRFREWSVLRCSSNETMVQRSEISSSIFCPSSKCITKWSAERVTELIPLPCYDFSFHQYFGLANAGTHEHFPMLAVMCLPFKSCASHPSGWESGKGGSINFSSTWLNPTFE